MSYGCAPHWVRCQQQASQPASGLRSSHRVQVCLMQACACRSVGWDKDDVWFAHCCVIDDKEIKQFADHGIGIAHCPSSNMRLASGIGPVSCSWLCGVLEVVLSGLGVQFLHSSRAVGALSQSLPATKCCAIAGQVHSTKR